jgi:hypothetical protein
MKPLERAFTVCAWIRDLNKNRGVWFSYAVPGQGKEIQITDNGFQFFIFGGEADLQRFYSTATRGSWFHNCLSWSAATKTRHVYINGVLVDSQGTPAGRTLKEGGYLVIGNEQDTYGNEGDMDGDNAFAGELYGMNVFSEMLSPSEIRELARDMCSDVEEMFGAARHIRWEDVLQASRKGNVYEIPGRCGDKGDTMYTKIQRKLEKTEETLNETIDELKTTEVELEKTVGRLDDTAERLNRSLKKNKELEKAITTNTCPLNVTVTSHWDFLYSKIFYNETLSSESIGEVRSSLEKLGKETFLNYKHKEMHSPNMLI